MNNGNIYSDSVNQFNYDVIMPKEVNSDTKIIVYSTTVDDTWNGYTDLKENISADDLNAIIVIPNNEWMPSDKYSDGVINAVDKVKSDYGIESDGYIASGFSNPSVNTIKASADYINSNADCDRQIVFLNDAVPLTAVRNEDGTYSWYDTAITDDEIATLENNNTFIVDYCRPDTFENIGERLLNSSVDILFVCDDNLPNGSWNTQHSYINNKAYSKDGLYGDVLKFIYENGELPPGYSYYVYNHETKSFDKYTDPAQISALIREKYNIDFSNGSISTKINLTKYGKNKFDYIENIDFGGNESITSDVGYARNLVNNIMGNIKQYASTLKSGAFSAEFVSTSKIPSQIPLLVEKYYKYNVDMMYELTCLLGKVVDVAVSYDEVDKKLADEVEQIDIKKGIIETPTMNVKPVSDSSSSAIINNDYSKISNVGNKNDNYYKIIENEFLNYDEIHSGNNKIVYASKDDNFRVVIHTKDGKVVGIEKYYKYSSEEEALEAFKKYEEKYNQSSDVYKVVYKDDMIKIIYKQDTFENLSINQVKEKYNDYNEIL